MNALEQFTEACLKHLQGQHNQKRHGYRYGADWRAFNNRSGSISRGRIRTNADTEGEYKKRYERNMYRKQRGIKTDADERTHRWIDSIDKGLEYSDSNNSLISAMRGDLPLARETKRMIDLYNIKGDPKAIGGTAATYFYMIKSNGGTVEGYVRGQIDYSKGVVQKATSKLSELSLIKKPNKDQKSTINYLKDLLDREGKNILENEKYLERLKKIR